MFLVGHLRDLPWGPAHKFSLFFCSSQFRGGPSETISLERFTQTHGLDDDGIKVFFFLLSPVQNLLIYVRRVFQQDVLSVLLTRNSCCVVAFCPREFKDE